MLSFSRIVEIAIGAIIGFLAVSAFRAYLGVADSETLVAVIADQMGWDQPRTASNPARTTI